MLSKTLLLISLTTAASAQSATIAEYPVPIGSYPNGITAGPDGALWFAEQGSNKIGRITTGGVLTEYPIPTSNSNPDAITAGSDGALWFAEQQASKIGRITTDGAITEYLIPTADSYPDAITQGPDGNLWFTENNSNKVGRITTGGVITEYPVPSAGAPGPGFITTGPDGALWFAESGRNNIGRITTGGVITEYPVTTGAGNPDDIAAGPDGALWFTFYVGNKIGRITTGGLITVYTIPTSGADAYGMVAGPDGAMWFTEYGTDKIGRITTTGVITEYSIPTANSRATWITVGPDGNLWFTEGGGNNIGTVSVSGRTISPGPLTILNPFALYTSPPSVPLTVDVSTVLTSPAATSLAADGVSAVVLAYQSDSPQPFDVRNHRDGKRRPGRLPWNLRGKLPHVSKSPRGQRPRTHRHPDMRVRHVCVSGVVVGSQRHAGFQKGNPDGDRDAAGANPDLASFRRVGASSLAAHSRHLGECEGCRIHARLRGIL